MEIYSYVVFVTHWRMIGIVSLLEGNEVFTGYVAGLAAMVGMIVVLLIFIVAQLHNIESKKD
ncbi:hypothetical protein [Peribacillus frigoritolerans]|uniref:hypothetical protein n=1 Tax=Peribacillus frigoritolerans TaxID=450367 RepID=UPI0024C18DC8|nr:hypothetical protein [Peribacillus frigoritolerans]MDM5307004.1 hypothetical protein [Peribacillus frigoritolerans]WHX60023.1 hypothetical protein QNH33_15405 [Peribacillus frigoritolerans]